MRTSWIRRYGLGARCYDLFSGEKPVYRVGRVAGIDGLGLRPGDRVLDVGCGTGLDFPLLREAVGPAGAVVGVDASAAMLGQAQARIARQGWSNVTVRHGDAGHLAELLRDCAPFNALIYTYSLSIISDWTAAWQQSLAALRPGGRVAVVDLAMPTGWGRLLWLPARLACATGGVDLTRRPWRLVADDCSQVRHRALRSGHIQVATGRVTAR